MRYVPSISVSSSYAEFLLTVEHSAICWQRPAGVGVVAGTTGGRVCCGAAAVGWRVPPDRSQRRGELTGTTVPVYGWQAHCSTASTSAADDSSTNRNS